MGSLMKDMIWVGLFATAITGCVGIPLVVAAVLINALNRPMYMQWEPITLMLVLGLFFFCMSIGMLRVLLRRRSQRKAGYAVAQSVEETQLMQALYQRSIELDRRLESLETILLSRSGHRERVDL